VFLDEYHCISAVLPVFRRHLEILTLVAEIWQNQDRGQFRRQPITLIGIFFMQAAKATTGENFLTLVEAASELRISERSLRSFIAAGQVHAVRLGQRVVRIPRAEIERLAMANRT
jgi:excisionase family DNA binding protein